MYRKLLGATVLFIALFTLNSCAVHAPKNSDVGSQIDQALQSSIMANNKVSARDSRSSSRDLSRALMPNVGINMPGKISQKAKEPHFDVSVNEVPAKTFFLGLVKGTP